MSTQEDPAKVADLIRAYGDYFADRDWVFTGDTGDLKHIRYGSDTTGYFAWWRRLKRWAIGFFERDRFNLGTNGWFNLRHPIIHTKVDLLPNINLPDGELVTASGGGGGVLTFWMEDGTYIMLMRPAVGLALADFLEADPDHPHAMKIAAEVNRAIADQKAYHDSKKETDG